MPERIEHPPEPRGHPATDVVVGDDEVLVADPGRLEPSREGGRVGQGMAAGQPGAGREREVAVDVEEERARDVPGVVGGPPVAGPAQVPAHVDDPEARIVEPLARAPPAR